MPDRTASPWHGAAGQRSTGRRCWPAGRPPVFMPPSRRLDAAARFPKGHPLNHPCNRLHWAIGAAVLTRSLSPTGFSVAGDCRC